MNFGFCKCPESLSFPIFARECLFSGRTSIMCRIGTATLLQRSYRPSARPCAHGRRSTFLGCADGPLPQHYRADAQCSTEKLYPFGCASGQWYTVYKTIVIIIRHLQHLQPLHPLHTAFGSNIYLAIFPDCHIVVYINLLKNVLIF